MRLYWDFFGEGSDPDEMLTGQKQYLHDCWLPLNEPRKAEAVMCHIELGYTVIIRVAEDE